MTKRTVYQANPDIYEHDLRQVVRMMDDLKAAVDGPGDLYIHNAEIELWSMNDYPVGKLRREEEQWIFTPHNESDVEIDIDVS